MGKSEDPIQLHTEAMQWAEKAHLSKARGDYRHALDLFRKALAAESQAAWHFKDDKEYEPTRSILFRSAASLALECRDMSEAARLASEGRTNKVPPEIEEELVQVLARIRDMLQPNADTDLARKLAAVVDAYSSGKHSIGAKLFESAMTGLSEELKALAYAQVWHDVDSRSSSEHIARQAYNELEDSPELSDFEQRLAAVCGVDNE